MSNLRDKELVSILNGARDDILRQMQDQALAKAGSDYKLYEKLLAWRDKAVKEARIDAIASYKKVNDKLEKAIRIDELELTNNHWAKWSDSDHPNWTNWDSYIDARLKELSDE